MTTQQVGYEIGQALHEVDFQEWDMCHQLSQLCDDIADGNPLDAESLEHEIEAILENAELGEYLLGKIKQALVAAAQAEA